MLTNQQHNAYLRWFFLIALCVLELYQLRFAYHPNMIPWDAEYSYLVSARHFLAQGWDFLLTEESLRYPPLAYLIYVPFLENIEWVRVLNNLLAVTSLYFVYQTIRRFGTEWQATFGLLIYVTLPHLSYHWGQLMTEPLFLFFTVVWLWATVNAMMGEQLVFIVVAVIALVLATLTRAVYIYFIYFTIFFTFIGLISVHSVQHKLALKRLFIVNAVSLFCLWLYMLKNWYAFDSFSISNGMSGALYQGLHPFFGGTAPPVNGNNYDINAIAGGDHLTILAEQRNLQAAKIILSERSFGEHIQFLLIKCYLVFFDYQEPNTRYWRLALLPFFCYGLWVTRPRRNLPLPHLIFWLIALLVMYQFTILLPILVLERYTTVSLAVPLAICGGYVYGYVWQTTSKRILVTLHLIAIGCLAVGFWEAKQYKQHFPRLNPVAYQVAPTLTIKQLAIKDKEKSGVEVKDNRITITSKSAQLPIILGGLADINKNALLIINVSIESGSCHGKQYLETFADNITYPRLKRKFALHDKTNSIRIGFTKDSEQKELIIGIKLHCDLGTIIQFDGIEGYYDLTPDYLLEKINHDK